MGINAINTPIHPIENIRTQTARHSTRCAAVGLTKGGLEKMKKFIKKFFDVLAFVLCVKGNEIEKESIENNLVSREGQGRDKYGN
jgi:hypothetical protein